MIWDKYGATLVNCFALYGNSLQSAYDVDGALVYQQRTPDLRVMTYNVQYFKGINGQAAMQSAIVERYKPDIIGMQELSTFTTSTIPAAGQTMLADYPNKQLSNHINKVMMATKTLPLSNVVIADFVNQDPRDQAQYNETRAYIKADIVVGGKTITWINTHLCYLTRSVMYQQMQEVFALAEACDYVIITGDFNSGVVTATNDDYNNMYKQFVDAGYHLANNSPVSGFHNTYTNATTATSIADLKTAPDTIIVSGNIDIANVIFDPTKLSYLNGSVIDHIPVIADLIIN